MTRAIRISLLSISIGLAFVVSVLLLRAPVNALSNVFADDEDHKFSTTVVSKAGAVGASSIKLDAPNSYYKIYSTKPDFTVVLKGFCKKFQGNSWARATLYNNNSFEAQGASPVAEKYNGSCWDDPGADGNYSASLKIVGATKATDVEGHEDYYTATLVVRKSGEVAGDAATVGITAYEVSVADTDSRIGFAELSPAQAKKVDEPGTKAFALVSEIFDKALERTYTLKFGTPCKEKSNFTGYLKWFDADRNDKTVEDGDLFFNLQKAEKGSSTWTNVKVIVKNGAGTSLSGSITTVSGDILGNNGAGSYRAAEFTLEPDMRYRWTWQEVNGNNGIQIWMPFSALNYEIDCEVDEWDYNSSVDAITDKFPGEEFDVTATVVNDGNTTGEKYAHRIQSVDGEGSLSWVSGGAKVGGNDSEWTNEGALGVDADRDRTGRWRVNDDAAPGLVCFNSYINPSGGTSGASDSFGETSGKECFNIKDLLTWNYDAIRNDAKSTPEDPLPFYPGAALKYQAYTTNIGTGTGPKHDFSIYPTKFPDNVNYSSSSSGGIDLGPGDNKGQKWTGIAAIGAGKDGPNKSIAYIIRDDADNGGYTCFRGEVTPKSGTTNNGSLVTTGDIGPDEADENCYDIYNVRYDLDEPTVTFPVLAAAPGETVKVTYQTCNKGPGQDGDVVKDNLFGLNQADRGPVSGVSVTSSGGFGGPGIPGGTTRDFDASGVGECQEVVETVTVPSGASVGEAICTTVEFGANYGFSAGPGLAARSLDSGPVTKKACLTVGVQPYFHVQNADVWAGGDFDADGKTENVPPTCVPSSGATDASLAGIHTAFKVAGSQTTYAALATGEIVGFSSARLFAPTFSEVLTFANDPSPGNLSNTAKCIPNYFELMYEKGEKYSGAVFNVWTGSPTPTRKQYKKDGNLKFTGAPDPQKYIDDFTFAVKGDITISPGPPGPTGSTKLGFKEDYGKGGAWNVPSLVLVAQGDIFIDKDVTQIDAVLIAHGTIWTCTNGSTPIKKVSSVGAADASGTNNPGDCTKQLTINGALIANRIQFMRTHGEKGGVHHPTGDISLPNFSQPAEIINFSPEFFLSNPLFGTTINEPYAIDQTKDLPPVY